MLKKTRLIVLTLASIAIFFLIAYLFFNNTIPTLMSKDKYKDTKHLTSSAIAAEKQPDKVINSYPTPSVGRDKLKNTDITQADSNVISDKVIYLTIDDGPSSVITDKMLDILKAYNVKATFFVIGRNINGNEAVLQRIHDEGHAIGLHSYTHDIKYIYASDSNLINEMLKSSDTIKKVTGVDTKIIRFPGGSRPYLNKGLLDKLHGYGYKIFDWTISAGDGTYPKDTPKLLFENATDKQYLTSSTAILLMHCKPNNETSCEALPVIIEYYKKNGYQFKLIDENTMEYYYKVK